jgi:hypothetical protein
LVQSILIALQWDVWVSAEWTAACCVRMCVCVRVCVRACVRARGCVRMKLRWLAVEMNYSIATYFNISHLCYVFITIHQHIQIFGVPPDMANYCLILYPERKTSLRHTFSIISSSFSTDFIFWK